jgi:predicted RNA-binding protein with PUA-like domain
VASAPYPDTTQFDPASPWFDPKSSPAAPRWVNVDIRLRRITRLLGLSELRTTASLASLLLLRPGNRLSITPVTATEWQAVLALLGRPDPQDTP